LQERFFLNTCWERYAQQGIFVVGADQKVGHSSLGIEYLNLSSDRCTNKKALKNLFGQPLLNISVFCQSV
jgi:hypothetical protein